MATLKVSCKNQKLNWETPPEEIIAGNIKIDSVKFEFCDLWDGYAKTAVFSREDDNEAIVMLLNNDCICEMPAEVTETSGIINIGVFGTKDDQRRTTETISLYLKEGVATEGKPSNPTPDIYQQILKECTEAKEIAESVREDADNGNFNGKDGKDGTNGKDGKDGINGKDGADGKDGYTPQKGVDYWTDKDIASIHKYIDEKSLVDKAVLIPIEGVCAIEKPITSSQIYTLNIGSDIVFELPTIDADDTNYYQILILAEVITQSAIDWGTSLFFNGDIPDIGVGKYNFIFEYDGEEWCAGVIEKGVVA